MKKHELFPSCLQKENQKIHITKLADLPRNKEITDDELLIAHCGIPETALKSLENILTSVESLPRKSFENSNTDEYFLLQTSKIAERTNDLTIVFKILQSKLSHDPDAIIFLDKLLTNSLKLGENIGIYNETIESLPVLRDNKKTKISQSAGGKKASERHNPTRKLVTDISNKMKSNSFINCSPYPDKAEAIHKFILSKRTECVARGTIQKYLKEASGVKSKGGAPKKNKPSLEEINEWLKLNFEEALNSYFVIN